MRVSAQCALLGWLLVSAACQGDKQQPEPSSAEATEGSEDPYDTPTDTPGGTVGPTSMEGSSPVTPNDGMPPDEGMGPGTGGPPDIVGGGGGLAGSAGVGGEGGTGGMPKQGR